LTDEASYELLLLDRCADAALQVAFVEHDRRLWYVIVCCRISSNMLHEQGNVVVLSSTWRIVIARETLACPRHSAAASLELSRRSNATTSPPFPLGRYTTTMDKSKTLWRAFSDTASKRSISTATQRPSWVCTSCMRQQIKPSNIFRQQRRKQSSQPGDDPLFRSIVDNPPQLIRAGKKHNKIGLFILAAIPITAFALGCWQVQRLGWKSELIARFEDRLIKDPLPLPPQVNPDAIKDFDYRRVLARGVLRHDQEMLIGPRMHDGVDGYQVVTPLDRSAEFEGFTGNTTVLINRGWIPKDKADHRLRPDGLPKGTVVVEGLLREPWKKNMFTPENKPAEGKFYFPDVYEMATHTNSQPVWVEETMRPDLLESYAREDKGVPIGRPPEVNLRNNHGQVSLVFLTLEACITLTQLPVHLHMVQLECCHNRYDVDAVEEARERHQSKSPPEQVVVEHCHLSRIVLCYQTRQPTISHVYLYATSIIISLFARSYHISLLQAGEFA